MVRESWKRELAAFQKLQHAHLIRLQRTPRTKQKSPSGYYGHYSSDDETGDSHWTLVLEYMPGGNLQSVKGSFNADNALL